MSGAWAREADATSDRLRDSTDLGSAAYCLACALAYPGALSVPLNLRRASAIIRSERRRLDPEGVSERSRDWPETVSDEALIWTALRMVASVDVGGNAEDRAWWLRQAESALRTLHKRGRS